MEPIMITFRVSPDPAHDRTGEFRAAQVELVTVRLHDQHELAAEVMIRGVSELMADQIVNGLTAWRANMPGLNGEALRWALISMRDDRVKCKQDPSSTFHIDPAADKKWEAAERELERLILLAVPTP